MFTNYSISDLFSNMYKKKRMNALATLILFVAIVVPYLFSAVTNKKTIQENTNYSSYIVYKITSTDNQQSYSSSSVGGYGDFYGKLIQSNLNGAYLFNDQSDSDMKTIASELSTSETTLKNSNLDFWDKKIVVNYLGNNTGITIKILTTSKNANNIIEKKIDDLIDRYKDAYAGVTIEKLPTTNSEEIQSTNSTTLQGVSKSTLLIRVIILTVACLLIVVLGNILLYIFNPTINRAGDYEKYGINFVTLLGEPEKLRSILQYKAQHQSVVILATEDKVLDKFVKEYGQYLPEKFSVGNIKIVDDILKADSILFVEEYGTTRYKNLEHLLQEIQNLDKNVLGVATYKL